jgi:serine/threonine-protein kinase PknK
VLASGTLIADRYVVDRPLGDGGLASAFVVRDRVWNADVALKLVSSDVASREVLQREFLALRSNTHPRLARVHDFGFWRNRGSVRAFYTSTVASGRDLRQWAASKSWAELAGPIADVLSALGALHKRGLLHGDVHPGNVIVDDAGQAVLIDLSCVRSLADERAFEVSGTVGFIAPELLRGTVHRTADLFALGRTILELGVALPSKIARAVERFVASRPEDRPDSAEVAAIALGLPRQPSSASDLLGSVLVGRDDVLARTKEAIDAVERGRPGPRAIVLVSEDGVGTTRLLEELKVQGQLRMKTIAVRGQSLATMLAIALGHDPASFGSTSAVLAAFTRLRAQREPVVLVVDDADALPPADREHLQAVLRTMPEDGNVLLAVGSRGGVASGAHLTIALRPLDEREVRSWLRSEIPDSALHEIVRATGGYPKEIAALLAQLDGGAWDSRTLTRAIADAGTSRGPIRLEGLAEDALDLLALVCAAQTHVASEGPALAALVRRGLVVHDPNGVRLLRRSDAERIATALGKKALSAAHRTLAKSAESKLALEPERNDLRAALVIHLAVANPPEAERLLAESRGSGVVLRPAADALVATGRLLPHDLARRCAEIYVDAGEPARAIALVARCLRRRPPSTERDVLRRVAGQGYAQMGDSRRAAKILARLLPRALGRPEHAGIAASLSLALLKRGADASALEIVRAALADAPEIDPRTRLDLLLNAAFATSRSGATDDARRFLALARELNDAASPRGRFRLASAIGFVEYGAGETTAAVRAYKIALDLAEEHGLDDLVASSAMNYGSACHELGDLGRALDAYDRGHRLAVALAMPTTCATLEFDRAKVHADVGSWDRAAHHAEVARPAAARERMALIEAGAIAVMAEVASARGDHESANRLLDEAATLVAGASAREIVALDLQRARVLLGAGNMSGADRVLQDNAARVRELGTPDVEAAWLGARSAVALAEGRAADAILDLERALDLAEGTGQRALVAELEARMAAAFLASGSAFLAERHSARARELWEKTLASLPPELHDAFRRHPLRARTFAPASPMSAAVDVLDTRRILEINRRLNSASSTAAVLEEAMDAAISLTNAERGFLLVETKEGRESSLKVTVARNLDRETIRQGNLKFSRTVAERVVRTGEPVIAVDAAFDPRFTKARSVHAMKLKSLLCVPIRSPEGILGAIYVDHRYSSGSFRTELVDVLLALGDQAALALVKARLVEELRKKTKELEERNAEVEQLARGQALEIARLKRTIEDDGRSARPEPDKRRFDYGDMVAKSASLRRILGVLDRVIDTEITVLVRGESGTGKERIARAIHANSTRASGPFVAINCGALPEPLLEAELFGYKRGAFSGAVRDQAGLFVSAAGGTLFLDELGEMPPSMQVKLLRVLQEREVRPLGANEAVSTDVRLVCATNRNLIEEVHAGRFREDLFYRVAVVDMELPPLRKRLEDILPLAEATLARLARELGRPQAQLDRRAERALLGHEWPGNVRELENVLTKAFLLGKSNVLDADDLELGTATAAPRGKGAALRLRIVTALEEADWNVVLAAQLLAMPRATLYRKMTRFGIRRPERVHDA